MDAKYANEATRQHEMPQERFSPAMGEMPFADLVLLVGENGLGVRLPGRLPDRRSCQPPVIHPTC